MSAEVAWPVTLSQIPRMNGAQSWQAAVIRSDTDHGPGEIRQEFTAASETFDVTYRYNEVDANLFWTWYTDTCLFGGKTFSWTNPRTRVTTDFLGTAARFRSEPESTNVGYSKSLGYGSIPALPSNSLYDIRMQIEILPVGV